MHQFKAKHSGIKPYSLCLGNFSKGFKFDNMEKKIRTNCKSFFC